MKLSDKPSIELLHGDCMDYMATLPDNAFELAIVDPPYGIGMDNQKVRTKPSRPNTYLRKGESQYSGGGWDDERPNAEYFEQLFRISKNQIIWGANYLCEFLPSGYGWIFWHKHMGENKFSAGEFAFQSMQIKSAMFSHPSMRVQNTRIHPTQKPVALYRWLLHNYAKQGDRILDTHLGSGSSAIACHGMGFDMVGIELDADYYTASVKRFKEQTSQLGIFT
jgi:site-specific DNA-methyltransferase (adenine-specific)